jgi:predicted transcriptional regulator
MDTRTSQLLDVLDPLAIDLLLAILERPRSEKELVLAIGASQPTVHRRLNSLAHVGIIDQPTAEGQRGQPWRVTAVGETKGVIAAVFDLADALEASDRQTRAGGRRSLGSTQLRAIRSNESGGA